ncbi:methylenetetrahydrofolate reductase [candidate division KSB1 bacterium]
MKVIDHIKNSKGTLFTFELLPPLRGDNIQSIYDTIDPLIEFNPAFIDITYHREDIIYTKNAGKLLDVKVVHKRPGTVGITAAIMYKYNVDVVPHIICGGFSVEDTENALIDLHFLGINNLLVVRGDNLKGEKFFIPEEGGHAYALDLLSQIIMMNKGKYLDKTLENSTPTNFSLGVAGYPEKHVEAPNMKSDIKYLKKKIEAGADYIVTQMFFDNQKYFDFVKLCRESDINVPVIPGLKPISTIKQISRLPQTFNIDLPDALVYEVEKCKDNIQAREVGVEWAIQQSRGLLEFGVPALHYYTMGRSDNIRKIAKAVL